ncbi:MAG: tryptophan 2,3-dioxygenase family protein, partial [Candidatus Binatia bacterium]
MNKLLEELLSNPRFAEALGKTVQAALETKGRVDRNMQTVLSLLNLPSKSDYKKLATKIEALQGSMVNLSIKLDRVLAAQKPLSQPQSHDELQFIIVHQTFELWFKQMLHEVDAIFAHLAAD